MNCRHKKCYYGKQNPRLRKAAFAALLLFFCLIIQVPIIAEESFFDGNDWKRFVPVMKISYISGLYDGAVFCEVNLRDKSCINLVPIDERFPMGMPFKDVVAALDIFYSNIENSRIPIPYAVYIVKMQRDGVAVDEIDGYKKRLFTILDSFQQEP